MNKIFVNEREVFVEENLTLFDIRDDFMSEADVVIYNGHLMSSNISLKENDEIYLIKKGEIPKKEELEYLMMSRHTPGVYKKLKGAKVAIAGLGGLGSNIAISLARMGVGYLKLIDFDVVEPSNLNRQQYFINQIGKLKTMALVETLNMVNPYLTYEPVNIYVTKENIKELFFDVDIIIEAFDKAENKAILITNCLKHFPDKCIIGASGVAGLYKTELINIKKVGRNCYIVGDFENEAKPNQGLMATRVAVAANIQAHLAVRYIMGDL